MCDIDWSRPRYRDGELGEENSRRRVARSYSSHLDDPRNVGNDPPEISGLHCPLIYENWNRAPENSPATEGNDQRDRDREHRVHTTAPVTTEKKGHESEQCHENVASRVLGIGQQKLATNLLPATPFEP